MQFFRILGFMENRAPIQVITGLFLEVFGPI